MAGGQIITNVGTVTEVATFLGNANQELGLEGPFQIAAADAAAQIGGLLPVGSLPFSAKSILSTPPSSPAAGDRYIIGASPTGVWAGRPNEVAEWRGGAWVIVPPTTKMFCLIESDHHLYAWSGTQWSSLVEGRITVALAAELAGVSGAAANTQAEVIADIVATTVNRSRAANVATLELSTTATLSVGNVVNVRGVGGAGYNGRATIASILASPPRITYASTGANESSTADAGGKVDRNGVYTTNGAGVWTWKADYGSDVLAARVAAVESDMLALEDSIDSAIAAAATTLDHVRDSIFSTKANPSRGTLKALWYADGPKTFYADGVVSTLVGIDANARTLALHTTLFSGADPRPLVQAKGLYCNNQAGLNIANGLLSQTERFCIHHAFEITVTNSYALKSDMVAAGGTEGDIARVTGDVNTTHTPDITQPFENGFDDSVLVNGFWARASGAWATYLSNFELFALTSNDGKYIKCSVNRLGQITVSMYNGARIDTVQTIATNCVGNGAHQISLWRDIHGLHFFLDGDEIDFAPCETVSSGVVTNTNNITNLANFYLNGDSRSANTSTPVGGIRHYFKTIMLAENVNWDGFRASYDAIADYAGTPRLPDSTEIWGVFGDGQSWRAGSIAVPTPYAWLNPNTWGGELTEESPGKSGRFIALTKEHIPRVLAHKSYLEPRYIGALNYKSNALGNTFYISGMSTERETVELGMMKHILSHPKCPNVEWLLTGAGAGGWSLSQLSAKSAPNKIVQSLKGYAEGSASLTFYEKLLQGIVYARDFALSRGKRYSLKVIFWQQGHSDTPNTNYLNDFNAFYDDLNLSIKRITGQSDDVACFFPQVNNSSDGIRNNYIEHSPDYADIDQAFLNIVANRGTRPFYCIGTVYQITNFIHPYIQGHRWVGEILGDAIARVLFDGEDYQPLCPVSFTLGANYVDVGLAGVYPGKTIVKDQTNNNVHTVLPTQGINYSGGGLTITSITIQNANTFRINLSGAPAAGHVITATGLNNRFTNIKVDNGVTSYYKDQDWTVPVVANKIAFKEGNLNDLSKWLCAFRKVL
jgi:hypothetical protein